MLLARRQRRSELGAFTVLTALDLNELLRQAPRATVQVVQHRLPLSVQAEAGFALSIGRDPEVGDEFAPMCRHCSLPTFVQIVSGCGVKCSPQNRFSFSWQANPDPTRLRPYPF